MYFEELSNEVTLIFMLRSHYLAKWKYSYGKHPFQSHKNVPSYKETLSFSILSFFHSVSFIFIIFFFLFGCSILHLVLFCSLRTWNILFQPFKLLFWKQFRSSGYVMTCLETWPNRSEAKLVSLLQIRLFESGSVRDAVKDAITWRYQETGFFISSYADTACSIALYTVQSRTWKLKMFSKNMLSWSVVTCCISVSP